MSWYDNERALTYSEVYPNETAASDDFARAEAHGWTIQERSGVQGDVTDAMQRLSHVAMYPLVADASRGAGDLRPHGRVAAFARARAGPARADRHQPVLERVSRGRRSRG